MAPTDQKTEVVSPAEVPEDSPLPSDPKVIFLGGLFVLAVLAAAYVAREIVLPFVFAIVLKLLLQPALRMLERLHVPRILGSLLLILTLFGTIVGLGAAISGPARTWAAKLPEGIPRLQERMSFMREPIDTLQRLLHQVEDFGKAEPSPNAAASAMWLTGVGDPILWGTVAFLLNYVPILGTALGVLTFLLAGLLTHDVLWQSLLPAGLYFGFHLIEGETVTPMLLARRFTLNPVLVIISLAFWFWMWGIPGVILSMPMLAITKIICDRLKPLAAFGHFLEG